MTQLTDDTILLLKTLKEYNLSLKTLVGITGLEPEQIVEFYGDNYKYL